MAPTVGYFLAILVAASAAALENPPGLRVADELTTRMSQRLAEMGPDYRPNTEHVDANGSPVYINRLIFEDSPYLLQHAHNPVNWYAWGEEAFAAARRDNKPVFISIGYSTCHWCHVMERESFDNTRIARILNERYIAIKVDRERRPDIDKTYMTGVMMMTGRGGWPMSNFTTPAGEPFYGGTYFPPQQFEQLLRQVAELWSKRKPDMTARGRQLTELIRQALASKEQAEAVAKDAGTRAVTGIIQRHDSLQGGFGPAPKFPNETLLFLLLDSALRDQNMAALEAATHTLDAMATGGIYDQVGGGFHRYSTDDEWLVPHFEKMLYNQAALVRLYTRAAHLTGEARYVRVVEQTLAYIGREMTAPGGGFYSATDADSEGVEGRFFVWTPAQIEASLGARDTQLALQAFGVTAAGNFEGRNILTLPEPLDMLAIRRKSDTQALYRQIDTIREKLHATRNARSPPLRDDKIISAWNGMMITAFVDAYEEFARDEYLESAQRAAEFLWRHNRRNDGSLWRARLGETSSVEAVQEDYAYFAEALLRLYDVTDDQRWLRRAEQLVAVMSAKFQDPRGGFFMNQASAGGVPLLTRPRDGSDGAIASGNAVALAVLAHLAARTGKRDYAQRADATLNAFADTVNRSPSAFSYMLMAYRELNEGGSGRVRYAGNGEVRIAAGLRRAKHAGLQLQFELRIAPGWHINASQVAQQDLVPTRLTLASSESAWTLGEVRYPEKVTRSLAFQRERLALYEGAGVIDAPLHRAGDDRTQRFVSTVLSIQACSEKICLAPEEIRFRLPVQ